MKAKGAYDVRVADPHGFKHALPSPNKFKVAAPLVLWPQCKSVVVIIVPYPPVLDNKLPQEQREAQLKGKAAKGDYNVYHPLSTRIMSQALPTGVHYLETRGFNVKTHVDKIYVPSKLAAFESGLGVYGRSGLILHRQLGNRMIIWTLMTDAALPPDAPDIFETSCESCGNCMRTCRGKAYRENLKYPASHNTDVCLHSRARVLMEEGGLCQNCFVNCLAERKSDEEILAWLKART